MDHPSVLNSLIKTRQDNYKKNKILLYINCNYGEELICAQQRHAPYGSSFSKNPWEDELDCMNPKYRTKWWVFGGNDTINLMVIKRLNMRHDLHCHRANFICELLKKMPIVPNGIYHAVSWIALYTVGYPPKGCPITAKKWQNGNDYKFAMLTDQGGGLITCGACCNEQFNLMHPLNDEAEDWWKFHCTTSTHKKNILRL